MSTLDRFDRAILEIMQKSNQVTAEVIAQSIGRSAGAVQRRIKRLRETGIIESDVSIVSQEALGRPMTFILQVTLEQERLDLYDKFKKLAKNNPQVQQCYYITGSSDFIIIVTTADMASYEKFTSEFLFSNPDVKNFITNTVVSKVKTGAYIPTNEPT